MHEPRASCFHARRALELSLQWLYEVDDSFRRPSRYDLSGMMLEPSFVAAVDERIRTKMNLIRKQGGAALHRSNDISADEAEAVARELFHVLYWMARTYAVKPSHRPPDDLTFDSEATPQSISADRTRVTVETLRGWALENEARDAELARSQSNGERLGEDIDQLRDEVAAAKAFNQAHPDEHDYNEEATRDLYIDLLLREAGWPLDKERDREFEVNGMPNKQGVGFVDYVLWGDDGKPLAVVEAKRTRRDPRVGRQQAKLYADCLQRVFGQRPAIFYSSGYKTWLWDDERHPPREVQGFYTKDELALLVQRRATRRLLAEISIKPEIVDRPYQHRAIRRIGERFDRERQREALVVMATGAGKTRAVIALVDLLMRAGWVRRVLFLADRVALVNQAVGAFKAYLPEVATVNLVTERKADGRVYVSTYPTMTGLIEDTETGEEKRFGPGFFDLVVIDEAHRSVYQKYRAIFAYFDSLLVGLTATPKDEVDRNTYGLFNLKPGVPTDSYSLEEAVADGFLVPPRAISVPLKFPREGVKYGELSEAEREQWEEQDWGDAAEMPMEIDAEAVNRWLFNADTVDKVLATLMAKGHRVASGDRLGKTIIFAKNNEHAEFIAERFDANYPEYAGNFARVITYRTEYAQSLIDDFATKDNAPHIAISVDMLDTGIDVPEIVNLVFFKTVRSQTKFWQMLGRGTRLCPGLFGPGQDKRNFFVFDCCDNFAFFNQGIEPSSGSLPPSLSERLFKERVELVLALGEASGEVTVGERDLRDETEALLRRQVASMNPDNFLVRPNRHWVERYREREPWQQLDLESATELTAHLADLPSTKLDDDEEAKRFDLIVLELQLRRLRDELGGERLQRQVQEIAAGLLEQTAIPAIREEQVLLGEIADDEWWIDVTVPMLEMVRQRIRGLVRLLEKRRRAVVYTDFLDQLGKVEEVNLLGTSTRADRERFREKVRAYLHDADDHPALKKLRRNMPLARSDLDELEMMLIDAGAANPTELRDLRDGAPGLGTFVRSIVGLDKDSVDDVFSDFVEGRTFSVDQLHFIQLVIDHLAANGVMDPSMFYESPFTDVAPRGPEDLFPEADIEELVELIETARRNAEPPPDEPH
jgi:type I restriction enzyme, R subunit